MDIQNLEMNITKSADGVDVWLHFTASDGTAAAISIAALAERSGPLTARALKTWAADCAALANG